MGSVEIEGEAIAGFDTVPFAEAPVVLSQVQTNNDADFVRTRQQNVTATSFEVALEEEAALAGVFAALIWCCLLEIDVSNRVRQVPEKLTPSEK